MKKYLLLAALLSFSVLLFLQPHAAKAQLAQPINNGQFYIFGIQYTGDGLAPGWTQKSLFNGVNTWNIIDTQQFYLGTHSISWAPAAPFERGSVVSPTALDLTKYQFLYFYGRSTEAGQRFEVGFCDQNGTTIGQMVPLENAGPPLAPDRWALYNIPLTQFAATGQVFGLVFQDMNGAPQKKVFFDEIVLSQTAGLQPQASATLGQPATPMPTEKPVGPYNPKISPWVFIIPGLIIMLAIFFE
jgi:hypothetical protein